MPNSADGNAAGRSAEPGDVPVPEDAQPKGEARLPAVRPRAAARQVERREHLAISLPFVGQVKLPHPQDLAFYAGVGALVAVELLEWPAAVALGVGHALTSRSHNRVLEEFGAALEEV